MYDKKLLNSFYPLNRRFYKFLLIIERAFPCNYFEIFVKACKIIEATFIANLFDTELVFDH